MSCVSCVISIKLLGYFQLWQQMQKASAANGPAIHILSWKGIKPQEMIIGASNQLLSIEAKRWQLERLTSKT